MADLPAGRELDIEIAEKIMEWERGKRWGNGNGEWIIDGKPYIKHFISWELTPRYSTSIEAAWQVLEKLREQGFAFAVQWMGRREPQQLPQNGKWIVVIEGHERDAIQAPTAPLAICRASLAAMERKDETV